jgi:anti-sigma factor RsiW
VSAHVHDQLSAYLDNELLPGERATLEAHLEDCAACARELEQLAALDRFARALPAEAPEAYFDTFAARVRARIAGKPAMRRPWRMPAWTLAAAAALALAVVTPLLLREKPAPMSEAPRQPAALPEAPARTAPLGRAAELDQAQAPPATLMTEKPQLSADRSTAASKQSQAARPDKQASVGGRVQSGVAGGASGGVEGGVAGVPETAELRDEVTSVEDAAKREPAAELGFAQTPPTDAVAAKASAPPATAAPQAAAKARERTATNAAPPPPAAQPSAAAASDLEGRFRGLLGKKATSLAEARALREEWRALAEKAMGSEADEARVRTIEAGVLAYGLAHDAADLARLRSDAAGYSERPDAAQRARVRALLRSVGAE